MKRENEIEAFKPEPFWEVIADFDVLGKKYQGTWHKKGETRLESSDMATKIAAFCKGKPAVVSEVKVDEKQYKPPFLFTLSSLQTAANQKLKYSPKKTLDIAQKLYVKGFISYPRTDSAFVTKGEAQTFPTILKALSSKPEFTSFFPLPILSLIGNQRYVNEKKVTDHYAIIPTEQIPDLNKLSADEKKHL